MDGFSPAGTLLRMNAKNLIGRLRLARDERATVSLEGLLTGMSTWLAFSLLLNDRAEASPGGASVLPGSATDGGSSDGAGEGGAPRRMPVAQRSAPRRPTDSGSDWGDLTNGAEEDSGPALGHGGDGLTNRRRSPLGGDGAQGTSSRPSRLLPAPAGLAGGAPQASSPGGGFGGAGGFSLPLGSPTGPVASQADSGEASPGMGPAYAPARTPTGQNAAAPLPPPAPARSAPLAAPQPPRGLVVAVAGEETVVARSFAGPAVVRAQSSQVALDDATIDSRGGTTEWMEVVASRRLHSLATSTLGTADLGFDGETIGARGAQVLAGDATKVIRIKGLDDLHFALAGATPSTARIRHQTLGMEGSTLRAEGGAETLAVSALMDLSIDLQGHSDPAGLSLQLTTIALQDSEVMLGDTSNQVAIQSGYRSLHTRTPEGALDLSGSLESVGVANSRIHSGGGDDQVWVTSPMPTLEGLDSVGLLGSSVDLGEGDDLLAVQGAVIGSTIRPGGGDNRLLLEGRVQDSAITLQPDSTTSVTLGPLADVLTLDTEGPAWIRMALGDGADALQVASPFLMGAIDGGAGEDRFLFGWGATPSTAPPLTLAPALATAPAPAGPLQINGGAGRDLFLFNRPDAASEGLGWRPQLLDLSLSLDAEGGIGLTDRIGWSGATIQELIPSDSQGIGNPSLLPIAPLGLLLEGIRSGRASTDQLAIALTDQGGELLMIRGDGRTFPLVDLPDLRV
jgi:hypothetical protein